VASEHSNKQMRTSWLALSYSITSLASYETILYQDYTATGAFALLWPKNRPCHTP